MKTGFFVGTKRVYLPSIFKKISSMRNRLIIIFFALAGAVNAQFNELGIFVGGSNFYGDVGNSSLHLPTSYVGGLTFRHQFTPHYGVRLSGSYGEITNDDASSNWVSKQDRNLRFRSPIWEAALVLEINFLEFVTGSRTMKHSPYIFGGIGLFGFNPQAQYSDGEWYDLQPLGTEGQGSDLNGVGKYGLNGISLPFGIGYRISIGTNTSIAFETGFRVSSSDYIDDAGGHYVNNVALAEASGDIAAYFADRSLSDTDKTGYARANNQNKDWYVFTGVHLYFSLTPKNERCSGF
jgi:hypothetical protein